MATLSKKPVKSASNQLPSETQVSVHDFMLSYNENIPQGYPQASEELLRKFKSEHPLFFKHGNLWSLDEHRKKVIDWFQLLRVD